MSQNVPPRPGTSQNQDLAFNKYTQLFQHTGWYQYKQKLKDETIMRCDTILALQHSTCHI